MAPRADADAVARVAAAYAAAGDAVELGGLMVDGSAVPGAHVRVPVAMLNRHGLVAGATGTGKTRTLQLIAEQLSAAGVPVFLADIKGDLSGMAAPGIANDRVTRRAQEIGDDWAPAAYPVEFLTIGGVGTGAACRVTITSFGPLLLSKVLGLNETQESSLGLVFHFADKAGLPLLDLKDLRAVITHLTSEEGKADLEQLGGLSGATAGVILRELIALEDQSADVFFGEPEFDTADLLRLGPDGRGLVSIMELQGLQERPALFSTFLMWMLADLFHDLPEVGDIDKPKLVFFFDEAHLLFDGASKAFLDAIAQTVRLIRSKGVGIFFVTQTPADVPDDVLAQLGNRVQHALRAFTPKDAKALAATVQTFPRSDVYDIGELLTALGIGDAAITVLSENGVPTPVAWTRLRPPRSLMAPIDPAEQQRLVGASELARAYAEPVDRESAYELLLARVARIPEPVAEPLPERAPDEERPPPERQRHAQAMAGAGGVLTGVLANPLFKSVARSAANTVGREIARSLFGTAPRRSAARRRRW